ncbi:MAG: gliding motility lipoprotein GldH, partial [Flammeovirgaceae bacterium]|nr:gliding motility lipoprotein GldH [Flammeovirgaceae bacterium]MDW8288062.1 gliding motility lipoprotein GldH [Flammeovirgaceae bacterium]
LIAAYLRNTLSYPYYNIYVQYALRNAQGDTLKTATVEWMLMHSKTGYPFGKVAYPEGNGVGYYYDHLFPLFSNYQFPDTGIYHVSFKQYMRLDTLPHIHAIGLRIQKEN